MQPQNINPKELSITELKALGFDETMQIEFHNNEIKRHRTNIIGINQELASRETPRETSKIDQGEEKVTEMTKDSTEG